MYYTIYKITNKINGKSYIGAHKTKNVNDDYMGSGKISNQAIKKYGIKNFDKEILFIFDNPYEMYVKEAELVNDKWVANKQTYNLKEGGTGGFDYINGNAEILKKRNSAIRETFSKMSIDDKKEKFGHYGEQNHNYNKSLSAETKKKLSDANTGKKHTIETNMKKARPGKLNGMYGKHHTEKTLVIMRQPKSAEHKNKISEAMKGKKQIIVKCPICNKQGGISNMKRYHYENCKENK